MRKSLFLCMAILLMFSTLAVPAAAAPPTVTIMPYTGGSVSLIGYELIITPHSGYYLAELYINGEPVEPAARVTLNADTNYTVQSVFKEINTEIPWTNPYKDVSESDWFFESVKYMNEAGIMSGTAATIFSPDTALTRAMVVTMLYRLDGSPAVSVSSSFPDVPSGIWYTEPVAWACEQKIVRGYEDGSFKPEQSVSREEIAVILFNYALYSGRGSAFTNDLSAFPDGNEVSDWALLPVCWAVDKKIITGKETGAIDPLGPAERCEAATMLHRYVTQVVQ